MENKMVIGMDYGTSGVKALVYDSAVKGIVASAYREYPVLVPQKNYAEHDGANWWDAFCQIMSELFEKQQVDRDNVQAICISCHSSTLTPVSKDGTVLYNGIIWADGRAEKECQQLTAQYGQRIKEINPFKIRAYHTLPKYMWFKTHEPELYQKTDYFLENNSYINFKLTGEAAVDRSQAFNYHFYNVHTQQWDKEIAALVGLDLNKFPKITECGEIIGEVTAEAARQTGLRAGTKVFAGMLDVTAATLGMGLYTDDRLCFSTGTGGHVVKLAHASTIEKSFTTDSPLSTVRAADPEYLINVGALSNIGGALKWMRNALCRPETVLAKEIGEDVYEILNKEAANAPVGSNGVLFLPYVAGEMCPIYNKNARGVYYGIATDTNKSDMVRAVMEGTCFAARQVIEVIVNTGKANGGKDMEEILVTGGPGKSDVWMQILCDVIGIPIVTLEIADGGPVGDILLAGATIGLFTLQEGISQLARAKKKFYPVQAHVGQYNAVYQRFLKLQKALLESIDELV